MALKATHFSASSGLEIPAHEIHGGSTGFISWQRLSAVLRVGGELRPDEGVLSFQVDDRGLSFRVEANIR